MIPLDLSLSFAAFAKPLAVRDTGGGSYVGGRWTPEPETSRTILAVVLQLSLRELEILNQGDASGGGIAIHTPSILYSADLLDDGTTNQQTRQSYIDYGGYAFRVTGDGFIAAGSIPNANFNHYKAVRYDAR